MYMPFLDNRTVTALDIKSEDIQSILAFCGRSRKRFIEAIIYINFPEYYINGTISDKLGELIEKYRKDYTRRLISKPIYLGWEKRDPIDDKTATLLNIKLGSGASDFVEHIMTCTLLSHELSSTDERRPISENRPMPNRNDDKVTTVSPNILDNTANDSLAQISDDSLTFMKLTEGQFDD